MRKGQVFLSGLLAFGCPVLGGGCSSDCATYCDHFQECINDDLDTERCTNTCSDWSADNEDRQDRTAECADCVSGRTCAETLGQCIDDCLGIPGPR